MSSRDAMKILRMSIILSIIAVFISCSGSDKPAGKAGEAAKTAPAKQDASGWIEYGAAKDGSKLYYESKTVERDPSGKSVGFWVLAKPPKTDKSYTAAQDQLKRENKDYKALHFVKIHHRADCSAMVYDITKTQMLREDKSLIGEQPANVRGRKPGPDVKALIERLCSGAAQVPQQGSAQSSSTTCEKAGIMVMIQPREAVRAGAQWRIEGREWKDSGDKVCNLAVDETTKRGRYKIEYKPIPGSGYAPPEPHYANITNDYGYSFYTSLYVKQLKE